ncbi:MAG: cysteine--tRNA ligase [Alphaproteobacteria bacterium HGW-Alphaproteobacteria-6]|nr:MAG: cysteine--tRNA ligase [Alphaproteobacteria bacterium HGW-Alphaproteobacteria-6]
MTGIRLHNTLTRRKEDFAPLDPENVRMYVCGPTVYDRAHLGNARPVVVFDVLFRLLRHVYGAEHVTYVRNFTDVDDKINARAAEMRSAGDARPLEAIIRALTDETIRWYHDDMDALGALRPSAEPRATEWIGAMVAMTRDLIAKGHAYERDGHVLFRVRSYKDYGRLSGRSVDDMIAGARVEVAPFKEDPMDFVLWKPSTPDLPGWDSPWGRGRPGWHIECSAMARELLGETFDIHGGGIDLQFPHHENEIAQSICAHPEGGFARVWLHNEMLLVEGRKMSKSLGNFFTVRDLLEGNWSGGWKVPGEVIRFVYLSTHYSKPMDWTEEKARQAMETLTDWYSKTEDLDADSQGRWAFLLNLFNDLDTAGAIGKMHDLARDVARHPELKYAMEWFGFGFPDRLAPDAFRVKMATENNGADIVRVSWAGSLSPSAKRILMSKAHMLSSLRAAAKETKDFAPVDALKSSLVAAGVEVRMAKNEIGLVPGPDFDPAKLEALK